MFAAALSLILFMTTAVMWLRTNVSRPGAVHSWPGFGELRVTSYRNHISVDNDPQVYRFHTDGMRMIDSLQSRWQHGLDRDQYRAELRSIMSRREPKSSQDE